MKLLEYEAKRILREYDIPLPNSEVLLAGAIPSFLPVVLKSQVPTGGRGKVGGVKIIEEEGELKPSLEEIFKLPIKGFLPKMVLAEELIAVQQEYYLSLFIDKPRATISVMAHKTGGVEVEENNSETFLVFPITPETAGERLSEYFDLPEQSFALQDLINNLYRCFIENDATLIEINPLILTKDNKIVAGDCKMELDSAAAFRHPDWDFENKSIDSNFVTLDDRGTIATIANGAGLAMATVDAATSAELYPANFLDIGGGANRKSILDAFQKIMGYPNIKAIVINIFAGITRCDEVAKAVIEAKKCIPHLPPLYIRLAGTNVKEARKLLTTHDIPLLPSLDACLQAIKRMDDDAY